MKKATFYTLIRTKDGESIAQEKTGYTFTEYGYTFNLYKIGSVWCVIESSTGLQIFQARTLKEAPAKVSEYIDTLKSFFSHAGEQTKAAIKIIADATNKAQAVDGEKKPTKAAEPIPTDTETPATSAGTVRTEKTAESVQPCTPCTMTAARRKWYNIGGNVYRSDTEPNHGASLVKSILSGFNIRTLTSMHRTEKHGYMSATRSHKAIYTWMGTAPGRTPNRTHSRTNCEVMARGSPENIASLQALILAS